MTAPFPTCAAVALDANDPAAKFENWHKGPLTAAEIEQGKKQVEQMLKDRPAMAQYGGKADVLYDWATRKFAGEDLGERILWDSSEPDSFHADNRSPTEGDPGYIRIRKNRLDAPNEANDQSFEELWSQAIFELYNITSAPDFNRFRREAGAGRLTKDAFVTGLADCESRAAEKTRTFYIHVFLPWTKENHIASNPELWYVGGRSDCKDNLALMNIDKHSLYWTNFECEYDQMLVNSLLHKRRDEESDRPGRQCIAACNDEPAKGGS